LASGLAHEIGNPIGIVLGYLELLKQEDIKPAEQQDFVNRSIEEIQRINTIIRQLLDFARKSDEGTKHISVHKIIEDLSLMVQVQPFMANIALICDLHASDDMVLGEADPLRQVFLNLILNAADAIRETNPSSQGQLRIESRRHKSPLNNDLDEIGLLEICFIDNGIGIATEDLDNIFDPFFTTKDPGKGTGLGLSVSYAIIERFGGQMSANSQPGEGTRITIKLPLAVATKPDSNSPSADEKKKIMV
jgi:signal transduction histidine kinase